MKVNKTYESKLEKAAKEAETRIELMNKVDCIVEDILKEDERFWGIGRKIAGHETWHMTLWVNEYQFGHDLAGRLNYKYIVTHDENKKFTINDFKEIINNTCQEYAYDKFLGEIKK